MISEAANNNKAGVIITFIDNSIGPEGARLICELLTENSSLTELTLNGIMLDKICLRLCLNEVGLKQRTVSVRKVHYFLVKN